MSEAADELERIADELEEKRDAHATLEKRYRDDPGAMDSETMHGAAADAWGGAAKRLRERAAELRAQRCEPTRRLMPRPSKVKPEQRWEHIMRRVHEVDEVSVTATGTNVVYWTGGGAVVLDDLLVDPDWTYLGDCPEPQNA
jgi:hypothetical protein